MSDETQLERAERLLIDTIRCLPGYSSCGDISVEQRVRAECEELLGDRMPLPVYYSSCRYFNGGRCRHTDNDRGSCPGWKNCNIENKGVT